MKKIVAALFCIIAMRAPVHAQEHVHGVHIGLFYPISTHGTKAGTHSNVFSLHAIAGVSAEEKAFSASGFLNLIHSNAEGFQVAGFMNAIGGFSEGFKAAGFLNRYQSARGFQAAGFANFSGGNITGMQAAGFMNHAHNVHGTQAAGFMNTAESVHGAQLAGLLNIAQRVHGTQIGFINIADSSDHSIGLVNIIGNGERWLGLTIDDNLTSMITFRSGTKKMYGIVGLGANLQNSNDVLARQFGIGAHFFSSEKMRLNTEATITTLENFSRGDFEKISLVGHFAFSPSSRWELFGGPTLNYVTTDTRDGKNLIDYYMWTNSAPREKLRGFYLGFSVGAHMSL